MSKGSTVNRRDFVTLLGGAVLARPFAAYAQSPGIPTIGISILSNPEPYWAYLEEGFRSAGYVSGKNIQLEFRSADGNLDTLARQSEEFVRAKVHAILAIQTPAAQAAIRATRAIPIVIAAGAPVETGLVERLHRPGGNVTGMSTTGPELAAKTLEIMRDALPALRRVAVFVNANDLAYGRPMLAQVEAAAAALGIAVRSETLSTSEDYRRAFTTIDEGPVQALIVQPSLSRAEILPLALKHRLPVITPNMAWTRAGAFMSYAPDLRDICRKAVGYVDRILKGQKPSELPVEQPTKFELVINLKTAHAIGVDLPPIFLARADEVIE
jgi:putative ABC transport system substrate-binding protein